MSENEHNHLQDLLASIRRSLGWDDVGWSNYDFERLSEIILEKTGTRLSVTTLKRLWGKVKYDSDPNISTLNALSRFAGYDDWRAFKQSRTTVPLREDTVTEEPAPARRRFATRSVRFFILGLILLICIAFVSSRVFKPDFDPDDFRFAANKVLTTGVPNSVIFKYDASKSPTDSVFIVQTWDARRKTLVSREGTNHSAIYYYPGFFRSKLIVGNTIVRTHDIQIATDGWLALVEAPYGKKPYYFPHEEVGKEGELAIDDSLLTRHHQSGIGADKKIRIFNQRDMGRIATDAFEFATSIRLDYDDPCHFVEVLIQLKDDIIIIPLAERACVGDLSVYGMGAGLESKSSDLSGFGVNLREWVKLRVTGKGHELKMFVNEKPAVVLTTPNTPAEIVGLQYRLQGAVKLRDTWFRDTRTDAVIRF